MTTCKPSLLMPVILVLMAAPLAAQNASAVKVNKDATETAKQEALITDGGPSFTMPTGSSAKAVLGSPESIVLATWDGGELTNRETSISLSTRRTSNAPTLSADRFDSAGKAIQTEIVKQLALEKILFQKAGESGITESSPGIAPFVTAQEEALLNRYYFQEQVAPQLNALTERIAQDYYNDNINRLFTTPAETIVRALHVSTYEQVTAEEGDTLNGIAERISGSKSAASRIVEGKAPYFNRSVPTEVEDKVLSSPLKAGEVLYVPMDEDAQSSASKLAGGLREKLLSGADLDSVASGARDSDFSVSTTLALDLDNVSQYYDGLADAAHGMGSTTVSQVIKTPAGYNVLVVEDRTTTQTTPFSEVKDTLMQRVSTDESQRKETVERTREMIFDKLYNKYKVEINRAAIARSNYLGADALSSDTVIARVDDRVYHLDDFLKDLRMTGKDWGQLTEEERLEVVRVAPKISSYVIAKEARALGLDQSKEFKSALKGIVESQIVAEYKRTTADPAKNRVSDAMLREYYQNNLDRYTSAAQVTVRELSKRINMTLTPAAKAEQIEKAKASLAEIKNRIRSRDDFAQLARRESEAISTRSKGGLIGTVAEDFRGEAFRNQLRQLQPGDVSAPFLYGSEVMIVRMDDRTAPTVRSFEEVRRQVMLDYATTEPRKRASQETEEILKAANFKLQL